MKKRILLIDESLTVQKVVALTLDKSRFVVSYARSRAEAMKIVVDSPPELILVSDQVSDINVTSFPKEVEAWMGREPVGCPIILITGQDIREFRHYAAVLKKPFSPQALLGAINELTRFEERRPAAPSPEAGFGGSPEEFEDQRLQKVFNETFADEAKLVRQTLSSQEDDEDDERTLLTIPPGWPPQAPPAAPVEARGTDENWSEESWNDRPVAPTPAAPVAAPAQAAPAAAGMVAKKPRTVSAPVPPPASVAAAAADLWTSQPTAPASPNRPPAKAKSTQDVMGAGDSMVYKAGIESQKAAAESQVETHLQTQHWDEIVDRALSKILPPIVERLVQERLDQLLKEQEQSVDVK